jgi:16S rRNA (guanine1207-N2)-methyltransferase
VSHYYSENQDVPHSRKEVSFRFLDISINLITDSGIFSKDHLDPGSELLLKQITRQLNRNTFCDVGCGYGVIGITVKKVFPQCDVTMFDINQRAVEIAIENCKLNNVQCEVIKSDGFENISNSFDMIAINPPIRAGKPVVYRLFEEIEKHLYTNGILLVVMRKQHGAQSAKNKLTEIFGNCDMIDRSMGYWILKSTKH